MHALSGESYLRVCKRSAAGCIALLIGRMLALTEMMDAMVESKQLQRQLANSVSNDPHLHKLLSAVVFSCSDETNIDADTRAAHPQWFEGL